MLHPAAIVDIARTWLSLSAYGRAWLDTMRRYAGPGSGSERQRILNDPARRKTMLRSVRVCDRVFHEEVPPELCRRTGRDPYAVYLRFVPFACLNVEIRARILDAFRLEYDEAALARVAFMFMSVRENNDLKDRLPPAEVHYILHHSKAPPRDEALLCVHLVRTYPERMPRETFGQLWDLFARAPSIAWEPSASISLRDHLAARGHVGTLLGLHAALPELPPEVGEALKPFSFWFYVLDEFADLARDREAGRVTFLSTVENPEAELRASLEAAIVALRAAAPRPERLVAMMQFLTEKAIEAKSSAMDIEEQLLAGGRPTQPGASSVAGR